MLKDRIKNSVDSAASGLFDRKYTVMVGSEPLTMMVNETSKRVQNAEFMGRKVNVSLDKETVELMMDQPSREVNNLIMEQNDNYNRAVAAMVRVNLELAIARTDKVVLDRYARGGLIPDSERHNFIESVNRPTGLRGLLNSAVQKTSLITSNLVSKVNNFFGKINNTISNANLDSYKYLRGYQMTEYNKAPPQAQVDTDIHYISKNTKVHEMAANFLKEKGMVELSDENKELQNEFYMKCYKHGFTDVTDNLKVLKTEIEKSNVQNKFDSLDRTAEIQRQFQQMQVNSASATVDKLRAVIEVFKNEVEFLKQHQLLKNETLEDFKYLVANNDFTAEQKVDLLVENQEYLNSDVSDQLDFEDKFLSDEPIIENDNAADEDNGGFKYGDEISLVDEFVIKPQAANHR